MQPKLQAEKKAQALAMRRRDMAAPSFDRAHVLHHPTYSVGDLGQTPDAGEWGVRPRSALTKMQKRRHGARDFAVKTKACTPRRASAFATLSSLANGLFSRRLAVVRRKPNC